MGKFYNKTPAVPGGKIAGTNPVPGPAIGRAAAPSVDQHPAVYHGQGSKAGQIKPLAIKGAHGYGHVAKHTSTKIKMSGHPSAHLIGARKK